MGQKDLAAKEFERIPEVFADIINAFIYEGEQVLLPANLRPAPTESLYRAKDGVLRNQYSDMSKYEVKNGAIIMQYTLENQSRPDYRILLRKAGYEGGIYRQQYDGGSVYPAVTLVLYWGEKDWSTHADMHSFFRSKDIHEKVRKYIDNIKLYMYPMKHLPLAIRQRFKSDMRVIVDYLAEGKQYEPTDREIVDLDGTMRMLHALTGETDFIENMEKLQERRRRGERITMCEVVDKFVERGRRQGMQQGMEQGIQQGMRQGMEQGIQQGMRQGMQQGIQQGMQQGIQEEKNRCAKAFVAETVKQKQSKEYIMGILQTCFQLQEEEAYVLYREYMVCT